MSAKVVQKFLSPPDGGEAAVSDEDKREIDALVGQFLKGFECEYSEKVKQRKGDE